jgi:hypothetical protein
LFDVRKPIVENYLSWLCHQARGSIDERIDKILNKDNYLITSACEDSSIDVLIETCIFFKMIISTLSRIQSSSSSKITNTQMHLITKAKSKHMPIW